MATYGVHDGRMSTHNVIEAVGLVKRYGNVTALDGLDITAPAGKVTAVLGPNGAGKTTFVSSVATLLRPDSGELRVAGIDAVDRPRRRAPGDRPRRPARRR